MNTFLHELVISIDDRWKEVQLLIDKASKEENVDSNFYNALCRATVLLIVAHLEGFVKELAKSIVDDINKFSSFNKAPMALKRTFCKLFIDPSIGEPKQNEQKVLLLIDTLDNLETKMTVNPFLIENSYGNNKNPSPSIIERICLNFGIRNIFSWINNSDLDILFSGTSSETESILNKITLHITDNTKEYPYSLDVSLFNIKEPDGKNDKTRSFWETFLDQLLKNRNDIAHGSSLLNSLSTTELMDYRNKVLALKYALILVVADRSKPII